jgi:hypothetical protein
MNMKFRLFLLAAVALVLAGCSSETIEYGNDQLPDLPKGKVLQCGLKIKRASFSAVKVICQHGEMLGLNGHFFVFSNQKRLLNYNYRSILHI